NGVRPDVTNAEQSFHTDNSYNLCPPEDVGLLCLHPAMEGGGSRIVSLLETHNELRRQHPDLLPRLYPPFFFDRQPEPAPNDVKVIEHPIFEIDQDRLTGRLSRFQVKNGQALAGVALDAAGVAALDALDEVMARQDMTVDFHFEAGQMQFLHNRQIAHKRTGFRDWPEDDRKRHLVRLWLRDRGRPFYNGGAAPMTLVLADANVLGGAAPGVAPGISVTIEDGRIAEIAPSSRKAPTSAQVIDLGGAYLLPGLWDVHVHLEWPRVASATIAEQTVQYAANAARGLLESGVTAIRTAGTPNFIDVALKRAYENGRLIGPRIFAAGWVLPTARGAAARRAV